MSKYDNLDVTDLKEQDGALKQAIINAVKDTQGILLTPLPSTLTITKAQYDMLQHDPEMQMMYESKDHLYRTPLNVMEVIIK